MNIHNKKSHTLKYGISAFAIASALAAGAANAQTPERDRASGRQQPEPAPSTEPVSQLDEIVVTARYRVENQQNVPIALSVLSGEALAERGVTSLTQAAKGLPNVEFIPTGAQAGNAVGVVIRGVGQTDFSYTLQPGVGYYVDDVYQGTLFGQQVGLLDIASVQILRGPQGTLAGRNSEGGAVRIYTGRPTGGDTGFAEVGLGDFNRRLLRGSYDFTAIPDRLFVRVSAGSDSYDGFTTRYDYGCLHPGSIVPAQVSTPSCETGKEGGDSSNLVRVSARAIISDSIELTVTGEALETNGEPAASKTVAIALATPSGPTIAGILNLTNPGLNYGTSFLTNDLYSNYNVYGYFLPGRSYTGRSYEPQNDISARSLSATLDWRLSDSLTLKSISGYRKYEGTFSAANTAPYGSFNYQVLNYEQFSEELRLSGQALNEKLDWTLGGFYFRGEGSTQGESLLSGPGVYFKQDEPSKDSNRSAFLHVTYQVSEALGVEAGVRYSHDESSYAFNRHLLAALGPAPIGAPLVTPRTYETESDRIDYKLGVDYKLTSDAMVYASIATGYKAGGVNPRPLSDNTVTTFSPEELLSYELGLKSDWFDRRLRVNLAGFFSVYENLQLSTAQASPNGPIIAYRNVGKVELSGVEAEIVARPTDRLTIEANASYLHYKAVELGGAAYSADNTGGIIPGAPPASTPEWKGGLGVRYQLATIAGGDLTARADANFRTRTYFDNQGSSISSQGSYSLLNLGLSWTSADDAWRVSATAENALDKEYFVSMTNVLNSTGILTGQPGTPRRVLFTVRRNF